MRAAPQPNSASLEAGCIGPALTSAVETSLENVNRNINRKLRLSQRRALGRSSRADRPAWFPGTISRDLTPAIPPARINRAIRFRPTERPSAFSLGHEHAARHRFHAIQRGSCGYDASGRRRRPPAPKLAGSARRNSPRPKPSGRGPLCEGDTGPGARSPARTRLPPLPGCRAPDAGDGSHVEGAIGAASGVDPVWWTTLKLIFEVPDAPLPNSFIRRSSGDRWSIGCDPGARPRSWRVSSSRPPSRFPLG